MSSSNNWKDKLASKVAAARSNQEAVEPLASQKDVSLDDAYDIQNHLNRHLYAEQRQVGYKIGLTNKAAQQSLNLDEPVVGSLFAEMISTGHGLDIGDLIAPRCEAEIGFVLDEALPTDATAMDVLIRTKAVFPVLEIVDCPFVDWEFDAPDLVMDNSFARYAVVGPVIYKPEDRDLQDETVCLVKNGTEEEFGRANDVMSNPLESVSWLTSSHSTPETKTEAGDMILSGSMTGTTPISSGDTIQLSYRSLGELTVSFFMDTE